MMAPGERIGNAQGVMQRKNSLVQWLTGDNTRTLFGTAERVLHVGGYWI